MVYLDNASTTLVRSSVVHVIGTCLEEVFGNPSSLYDEGIRASHVLEDARRVLATALRCAPDEVVFTGSGTESNNIAVLGAARARRAWANEIVLTAYEHPSVYQAVQALQEEGFKVIAVAPSAEGQVNPDALVRCVGKRTALVACMAVNNETGARLDVAAVASAVKEINSRTAVHCDAVQAFCKEDLLLNGSIDTVALSAHKLHGPKGIGALYVRRGLNLSPTVFGGGQERGVRSGTENVAYAAGFSSAVQQMPLSQNAAKQVRKLNALLRTEVQTLEEARIHSPQNASPYILNFSLMGYKSETILHFLEKKGIYVSSGSACAKGAKSHTLQAMGLSNKLVDGAIRVSLCDVNTQEDIEVLGGALREAQKVLLKSGS